MASTPADMRQSCSVLTVADAPRDELTALAARFGLRLVSVGDGLTIPGSFWGEPEAGLVGDRIFVRSDTPVHSVLHEMSHVICMDPARRATLERDAGGDDDEESAVCYLQIVLADELTQVGRLRLMQDMDSWGYSFRLGSTRRWFAEDAADARRWLQQHDLLTHAGEPAYRLRGG